MSWQTFLDVTFTNGEKNVSVNDATATAGVLPGFALNYGNKAYEIEAVSSNSITLADPWPEGSTPNVKIKIQPTSEPIKQQVSDSTAVLKKLADNFLARLELEEAIITSTGTVQFTDSGGVTHNIPGWGSQGTSAAKNLATLAEALAGTANVLPDAAQVMALIQALHQPEVIYGIGVPQLMYNTTGLSISSSASVAGSGLEGVYVNSSGLTVRNTVSPPGMWTNYSGGYIGDGSIGLMVRVL